jgi:hypothetical protein
MRQYHRPHTVAERNVGALGFKLDARPSKINKKGHPHGGLFYQWLIAGGASALSRNQDA